MKDILTYIISSIVEKVDDIEITEEENEGVVNFNVKVAGDEMGKIIGKEGKVIRAIRNIMRIPAAKQGKRIYISLVEA